MFDWVTVMRHGSVENKEMAHRDLHLSKPFLLVVVEAFVTEGSS